MNQVETSVQTNLPMPKQQEVYYWEVKMFEKSPDTVVSVGVSTKPYPNTRMPGKIEAASCFCVSSTLPFPRTHIRLFVDYTIGPKG